MDCRAALLSKSNKYQYKQPQSALADILTLLTKCEEFVGYFGERIIISTFCHLACLLTLSVKPVDTFNMVFAKMLRK